MNSGSPKRGTSWLRLLVCAIVGAAVAGVVVGIVALLPEKPDEPGQFGSRLVVPPPTTRPRPPNVPFQVAPPPRPPDVPQPLTAPEGAVILRYRTDLTAIPPPELAHEQPPRLVALRELKGHDGAVYGAVFHVDGKTILSGGEDGTLRLWDVASAKERVQLKGHIGAVRAVAFLVGGSRCASAGADGTVRFWDCVQKKEVLKLDAHQGPIRGMAVSADGKRVLTGGEDRAVRLWDAVTGQRVAEWFGHDQAVLSVALSFDGRHALSGGADGVALTWDVATGREIAAMPTRAPIHVVRFFADNRRGLVAGSIFSCLWDVMTGTPWIWPVSNVETLRCATVLGSGDYLITGGPSQRLELHSLPGQPQTDHVTNQRSSTLSQISSPHNGTIHAVDANAGLALSAGQDGIIRLWQIAELDSYLASQRDSIHSMAVSADGNVGVIGGQRGEIAVWDLGRRQLLRTIPAHADPVFALAMSADGKRFFSGGLKEGALWETETGRSVHKFSDVPVAPSAAALRADGSQIACGGQDGSVRVWDVGSAQASRLLLGHRHGVRQLSYLRDGQLCSAGGDGAIRIWNPADGTQAQCYFFDGVMKLSDCTWSSDGRHAWTSVVRDRKNQVSYWDLSARRELVRFGDVPFEATKLAATSDGRTVVGGGYLQFHIWDADPPRWRWHVQKQVGGVHGVAFRDNDRQALVADANGKVRSWHLPPR